MNIIEFAELADCHKSKISRLVQRKVLVAEKRGRALYFDDAYVIRVAPILAVHTEMGCSLGWDQYRWKLKAQRHV